MKEPWQQSDEKHDADSLKNGEPVHDYWLETIMKMKEEMGAAAFNEFTINLAEQEEAGLRQRNPEHPLLKLLDAHRSREANGFF